jgi:glycosyltransferase involved in cell wall biosynthesis
MTPLFSVIIPVYNRAGTIEAALESVIAQTFTDYEIVVIDDGSTDGTVAVATAFAAGAGRPIRILQQANAGPGAARNLGIRNAAGQYVALLDSDDLWFPWTLERFHQALVEFNEPSFLCGVPIDIRPGETAEADGNQKLTAEVYTDFYSVTGNPFFRFTTSGVVIRKLSLEKAGGFAGERINLEDLDLWMRLGTEKGFVLITQPPLVVRRFLGDNISDSREHNFSGASYMIESEKAGRYPGGIARQAERRRLLCALMRAASFQMARSGDCRAALSIYFQIFTWSVIQFRVRYLLGLPVQTFLTVLRSAR